MWRVRGIAQIRIADQYYERPVDVEVSGVERREDAIDLALEPTRRMVYQINVHSAVYWHTPAWVTAQRIHSNSLLL